MTRLRTQATFRARELRRAATPAEVVLRERLRARRLAGAKFRRQQVLGPYIADFYCVEARLVVEADGAPHYPPSPAQLRRDALLRVCGIEVLRFENRVVLEDTDAVVERIRVVVAARRRQVP